MKIVADQNIPHVAECFAHLGEVALCPGRAMAPATVADADVLLVRSVTQVNAALLEDSPVRFVGTATIGVEHIDRDYLKARGIGFAAAPGSNATSVADWVSAVLLEIGHRQHRTLSGLTIGIVGVGNVGRRVARQCEALGLRTVWNDPPLARETGDACYRPLAEVLACDIVTLHTPLTRSGEDKSFHLADRDFFAELKSGAVFLNSGRGAVHDTAALKEAIQAGRLGGVALDVWEAEPAIDTDLLRDVDIATPHIAGYSLDGKIAGLIMIYEALCRHLEQETTRQPADFLPSEDAQVIDLTASELGDQQQIHLAVQQVYAIAADDARMRELLKVDASQRGAFFDRLRKDYPIRREYHTAAVRVADVNGTVARTLTGLGFGLASG